jgi:hypothetical protein
LQFFKVRMTYTNHKKIKSRELNPGEWGGQRIPPAAIYSFNDQEIPCPERSEHDGRSGLLHHVTGKLFPQLKVKVKLSLCFN